MKIHELKYSGTNTYLIEGDKGRILFDTGWAGTFRAFCQAAGVLQIPVQGIDYILISHFHPDHMGIAQEIADLGPVIAVMDAQRDYVHASDGVFSREKNSRFVPIRDEKIRWISLCESRKTGENTGSSDTSSRAFLKELGIDGELLHTPGHSNDSISLCLDDGSLFVGDLNPLYELELHRGTQIEESWEKLLARKPHTIYYGHARTWRAEENVSRRNSELYALVSQIMKLIDKGVSLERIRKKTGAAPAKEAEAPRKEEPLRIGEKVKVVSSGMVGEVSKVSSRSVTLIIGNISSTMSPSAVVRISSNEFKEASKKAFERPRQQYDAAVTQRKLGFKPEIDVRGERLADALDIVMHYVDDAIMVGVPSVRIVHGKGTGALHEEIQKYLRTVPGVASVADEDVRHGGSGVTVVTFG